MKNSDYLSIADLLHQYYRILFKTDSWDDNTRIYDIPFPDELTMPLAERKSGIGDLLLSMLNMQRSISEETEDKSDALDDAVGYADAEMVKFLLLHGADCNMCSYEEFPELGGNYYLDDIDIQYFDSCHSHNDQFNHALLQTARMLAQYGGIKEYAGYCLLINHGELSLKAPQLRY